jgi:hypothetical protein
MGHLELSFLFAGASLDRFAGDRKQEKSRVRLGKNEDVNGAVESAVDVGRGCVRLSA